MACWSLKYTAIHIQGTASPRNTCYYAVMLVDMGHLLARAGELFFDHCVIIPLPTDAENQEEPEKGNIQSLLFYTTKILTERFITNGFISPSVSVSG